MRSRNYHLEFLTPCFCGGAEPSRAELRASAIRGQLRWWFRCLGGSREEESQVFGAVHLEDPKASTLAIRIAGAPIGGEADWYSHIPVNGMHPSTYLLGFFCGRTRRIAPGGAISPGSKTTVEVVFRRPPSPKLELALEAFFSVGALGFRVTRAAGAFSCVEHALTMESWNRLVRILNEQGFVVVLDPKEFPDWVALVRYAGTLLKHRLRSSQEGLGISAGQNGRSPNVLGSAEPRQASVVHFRPVRINGVLRLALIEAPQNRIVGAKALGAHGGRGSVLDMAAKQGLGPPFS